MPSHCFQVHHDIPNGNLVKVYIRIASQGVHKNSPEKANQRHITQKINHVEQSFLFVHDTVTTSHILL